MNTQFLKFRVTVKIQFRDLVRVTEKFFKKCILADIKFLQLVSVAVDKSCVNKEFHALK